MVPFSAASSISKSVSPGTPTVLNGLIPTLAPLSLADDHVEAVVAQVHTLAGPLYAVADHGNRFILQGFPCFIKWKFFAEDYLFFGAPKV